MLSIDYSFPGLNCALERQGGRSPGEGLHLALLISLKMMEPLVSTSKDASVLKEWLVLLCGEAGLGHDTVGARERF